MWFFFSLNCVTQPWLQENPAHRAFKKNQVWPLEMRSVNGQRQRGAEVFQLEFVSMWLTEQSHVPLHDYESELSKLPRLEIAAWFSKVGDEKRGMQWIPSRVEINLSFKLCRHPRRFLCLHGNCAKPFTGGDIRCVVSHLNRPTLTRDGCHLGDPQAQPVWLLALSWCGISEWHQKEASSSINIMKLRTQ